MATVAPPARFNWRCRHSWRRASINTLWCLAGCSIGDMATIGFFQATGIGWHPMAIMALGTLNGVLTSIVLETVILSRHMALKAAFHTAIGMSLVSMVAMEMAMNVMDLALTGGANLVWWALPLMWAAGFLAPLPYNYWRLKAHGRSCH